MNKIISNKRKRDWKYTLFILSLTVPAGIFCAINQRYQAGAFLAYMNCIIIAQICIRTTKYGWWQGYVICISLASMGLFYAVAPLYLAFFTPAAYHNYSFTKIYYLKNFTKMELCLLVFLLFYSLTAIIISTNFYKYKQRKLEFNIEKVKLAKFSLFVWLSVVLSYIAYRILHLPYSIGYFISAIFLYLNPLLFVYGALITKLNKKIVFFGLTVLFIFIFIFTLSVSRGYSIFLISSFLAGVLFVSDLNTRKKAILILTSVILFPIFITSTNIVRKYGGFAPGFSDLSERYTFTTKFAEYLDETDLFNKGMLRFFPNGSHAVMTMTPAVVPYTDFKVFDYFEDLIVSLLPVRKFSNRNYTGKYILRKYGFFITEKTSTGIGLIGHFWMFGGFITVIIGAIAIGLVHGFLSLLIKKMWVQNQSMCLLCIAAVFPSLIWTAMHDFLQLVHSIIWQVVAGFILYGVYNLWIGAKYSKKFAMKIASSMRLR